MMRKNPLQIYEKKLKKQKLKLEKELANQIYNDFQKKLIKQKHNDIDEQLNTLINYINEFTEANFIYRTRNSSDAKIACQNIMEEVEKNLGSRLQDIEDNLSEFFSSLNHDENQVDVELENYENQVDVERENSAESNSIVVPTQSNLKKQTLFNKTYKSVVKAFNNKFDNNHTKTNSGYYKI